MSKPATRPTRVLHVIPSVAPRYGGPSTVIGPMVAALNRLPGVSAEIATTDADGPGSRLDPRCIPAGLHVHVFRRTWSERWKYSGDLSRWLRRHAAEYDIVHVHSLWSFASSAAARAARRAGVPYVVRPAGMLSGYTWGRGASGKCMYWTCVESATVRGAAGFHATSPEEAGEIRAVRPGARVLVVPNGVDEAAFTAPADRDALRGRCGAGSDGRAVVLFLSRLHPKKGISDLLLPALARMKNKITLAIAGGADPHAPGYEVEVSAALDRLGLSDRVVLLGPVAAAGRWNLYDGADVFVLPSRSENFGVVVAEAMARACPVVVSEGVQAKSHVAAAGAGVVVPPDADGLASALDDLVGRPALRAEMGGRGHEYAVRHFSWDSIAGSIAAYYAECLSARG